MVEIRYRGGPLPATFSSQQDYAFQACLNGSPKTPSRWTVVHSGATVAHGYNSQIVFTPTEAGSYAITAWLVGEFSQQTSVTATISVVARNGSARLGVRWSKFNYLPGDTLGATIIAFDASGQPCSRFAWSLLRNNVPVSTGTVSTVSWNGAEAGLYRLTGTATGTDGVALPFDSAINVAGTQNVRHSVPAPLTSGSLIFLGDVFTDQFAGEAGAAITTPYQLSSHTQDVYFLPGTTHWSAEVVGIEGQPAAPEVVVRTKAGNWALTGFPTGLQGENVGYDYQITMAPQAVPVDYRARLSVEAWVPRPGSWPAYNFRVRIHCYRQANSAIYSYTRCPYSAFPGGQGRRARRVAVLFTSLDIQTDVNYGKNRLGMGNAVVTYTTPQTTNVPSMVLDTAGSPNPANFASGLFFTDSNDYAIYEATGYPDIRAKAVAAIEGLRPAYLSLLTFDYSAPLICNRIKRLHGNLVLYLVDGAIYKGSTITLTIWSAGGLNNNVVTTTAPATVYANVNNDFVQALSMPVDIADFQFDETGVVVDIAVDESTADQSSPPVPSPLPVTAPDVLYSTVYSAALSFDGACYSNPALVPVFDLGQTGPVTVIPGCHDPSCGPLGLYCYSPVYGTGNIQITQPLGFPAPYVAYGTAPNNCYAYAAFMGEFSGTGTTVSADMVTYPDAGACGTPYYYASCPTAPFNDTGTYAQPVTAPVDLIVVYPPSAQPHAAVAYESQCYSLVGTAIPTGYETVVSAGSVTACLNCEDYTSTGYNPAGNTVMYADTETGVLVPVRFDHLDHGIPEFGVAEQLVDLGPAGVSGGRLVATLQRSPNVELFTAGSDTSMLVTVGMPGLAKRLMVNHGGVKSFIDVGSGTQRIIPVRAGDVVSLNVGDGYGQVPQHCQGMTVQITWEPVISLPRLYDRAVTVLASPAAISAVGFCGYTDQSPYRFFDALPATVLMSGAVNPDSIVTVSSGTLEFVLVSAGGTGDMALPALPFAPYSGQSLSGTISFNFYAGRSAAGAHGEMDVWFSTSGTGPFPELIQAGYTVLQLGSYRRDATPADTTRNAYSVYIEGEAGHPGFYVGGVPHTVGALLPYWDEQGRVYSAESALSIIQVGTGTTPFSRVGPDFGLAFDIIPADQVVPWDNVHHPLP